MGRAYIQGADGVPHGASCFSAYLGFSDMGMQPVLFNPAVDGIPRTEVGDVLVGGIGVIRSRLRELGREVPEICYPESLMPFLGRDIWRSTIDTVSCTPDSWPVFVKPLEEKLFAGTLVRSAKDLIGHGTEDMDHEVWCSNPVAFRREWRCFVLRGQILDARPYRGDWRLPLDSSVVESAVASYLDAPSGYALDFGVTDEGRTLLVEASDGYSIAPYGLESHAYARLLSARWSELAGFEDPCDFGPLPSPLL
jgi:hypothetical protein